MASPPQPDRQIATDPTASDPAHAARAVASVADLYEIGVSLYLTKMERECGVAEAQDRVQRWLAEQPVAANWRLTTRPWAVL
ncbi:MAG: hypothetical protein EXR77_17175 [Myxococcales bacterium]|nr:hypothetical protein [Myxococcales bacterium]